MRAAAEIMPLETEAPFRRPRADDPHLKASTPETVFEPFAERLLAGTPKNGADSAADYLSSHPLKAPVLRRAQRLYGNRVSQQLVRRARVVERQCACGGACARCRESEEPRALQRNSADSGTSEWDGVPTTDGEPLVDAIRRPLEAHFRADLAGVRVHTSSDAAKSAASLDALAYTSGRDIYFAAGMYSPSSGSGQRLLAHEVAHVVQQGSAEVATKSARGVKIGAPDDPLEGEAERAAEEFMAGTDGARIEAAQLRRLESGGTPAPAIQRQGQPQSQSTTALDATAQSIVRGAGDANRDAGVRAVEAVWRIISAYYPGKAKNVNAVTYDNTQAGTGLATGPYPASKPTSGRIFVGDYFLAGVQNPRAFAHHVLQVGHELEHIDQFLDPALGPGAAKKDEREFLAFYHEALAAEVPHTGRFQHGTRIAVIDTALGYYNCLAAAAEQDKKDAARRYEANQKELLTRRSAEIAEMKSKGFRDVPADIPPTGCRRQ